MKKLQPPFCMVTAERCRIVSATTYRTLLSMAAMFDGYGRPIPAPTSPPPSGLTTSICLTCGEEWTRIERPNGRVEFHHVVRGQPSRPLSDAELLGMVADPLERPSGA